MLKHAQIHIKSRSLGFLVQTVSLILVFFLASAVSGQTESEATIPIRIEADRMETSQTDGSVFFSGNVQATQGDLVINADQMTVIYTKAADTPDASSATKTEEELGRKIDKIKADGHVKIVRQNWIASGDTMDFDADDRIVILAGNAQAWQDKNMVSGEKIVLYLDQGKSVVEKSSGEGERVKAFIYPSSQDK